MRYEGSQTGLSFDKMDQALTFFNKTFGEYLNTGKGKLATPFKQFGIDKMIATGAIRDVSQAFDVYIEKVNGVGNASQRANLLSDAFGRRMGSQMAEFAEAGAAKLEALRVEAHKLGIVLSEDTVKGAKEANDKLKSLFSVIEAEGISAIANLAPEIAQLAEQIKNALPNLLLWVTRWADWFGLIKMNPIQKLQAQIQDQMNAIDKDLDRKAHPVKLFGVSFHSDAIDADLAVRQKKVAELKAQLAAMQGAQPNAAAPATLPRLHSNDPAAGLSAERQAEAAERAAAQIRQVIAQTGANAATAEAAMAAAANSASVAMLRGTAGYYDAVKKEIADDLAAKLAALDAEEHAKRAQTAKLEVTALEHEEIYTNITREFAAKRAALESESGAKAIAAQEEQTHALKDQIEVADTFRSGLESLGPAALRGAKGVKSALAEMLEQLVRLGIQMEFMQPLVEGLFGQQGTKLSGSNGSGSGLISGIIKAIPAFAEGTSSSPGGAALVGEHGPEIVNLPKGTNVIPNAPSMAAMRSSGGGNIYLHSSIDLTGANGDAAIQEAAMRGASLGQAAAVRQIRQEFPQLLYQEKRNFSSIFG